MPFGKDVHIAIWWKLLNCNQERTNGRRPERGENGPERRCERFAAPAGWIPVPLDAARPLTAALLRFAVTVRGRPLRCRLVVTFARLVDLVGALPCPLAAGTSAVPGGAGWSIRRPPAPKKSPASELR